MCAKENHFFPWVVKNLGASQTHFLILDWVCLVMSPVARHCRRRAECALTEGQAWLFLKKSLMWVSLSRCCISLKFSIWFWGQDGKERKAINWKMGIAWEPCLLMNPWQHAGGLSLCEWNRWASSQLLARRENVSGRHPPPLSNAQVWLLTLHEIL